MDLLALARGPLLTFSVAVFLLGSLWRLSGAWRRPNPKPLSPARQNGPKLPRMATLFRHMLPRRGMRDTSTLVAVNPYLFHLGLAVIVFGYLPHIAFIERYIGISWPAIPYWLMVAAASITIVSLLIALFMRVSNKTLRSISGPDDYISWGLVFLIVMTGMGLAGNPSSTLAATEFLANPTLLAVHLMSFELMLVWFPFGKLFHAVSWVVGRTQWGALAGRRGVKG